MASKTGTPTPRIRVRPAVFADRETLSRINFEAFGPSVMARVMVPNGISPETVAAYAKLIIPDEEEGKEVEKKAEQEEAGQEAIPASDNIVSVAELVPAPGQGEPEIVAFAKWTVHRRPRTEEEWDVVVKPRTQEMLGEGVDPAAREEAIGSLQRITKRLMKGDPAIYLNTLVCSTKYQRLGAGSALMLWGLGVADALGLPAWLEASASGYSLYRRFGFEDLEARDLAITEKWGYVRAEGENWGQSCAVEVCGPLKEGYYRNTVMRRPPVNIWGGQ